MLTNQAIVIINLATWGVSILIAVVFSLIAVFCENQYIEIKPEGIIGIATLLGTFSFTMTGFIAAIGAYIISVSDKTSFLRWRQQGYINIFYHIWAEHCFFIGNIFIMHGGYHNAI